MNGKTRTSCGCGITRRSFLADTGMGFTGLALGALLARDGILRAGESGHWTPDGKPVFAPKAKSVIWLFMLGGVSHVEGFDPKPALNKYAGKTISETPYKDILDNRVKDNVRDFAVVRPVNGALFPMQVGFSKRGQSGTEVSDWFPHMGGCVDDMAVVRSVWLADNDDAAQHQYNTGH